MKNDFWAHICLRAAAKLDKRERLGVIVALIHGAINVDGYTEADIFDLKDRTAEAARIIKDYHELSVTAPDNK